MAGLRDDAAVRNPSYGVNPRTVPSRNRQRVAYDRGLVHSVLDEAVVCHVGFVDDGRPVVLPQLHVRVGEVLYLHGSTGARALLAADDGGLEVCDRNPARRARAARSAFNHSVNYRSVVVRGTASIVTDTEEKPLALAALVNAIARAGQRAVVPQQRRSSRPRQCCVSYYAKFRSRCGRAIRGTMSRT